MMMMMMMMMMTIVIILVSLWSWCNAEEGQVQTFLHVVIARQLLCERLCACLVIVLSSR